MSKDLVENKEGSLENLEKSHEPVFEVHLAEVGLNNFEPYLMNRITSRYNNSLSKDLYKAGLTVAKMRVLAVLSVMSGSVIRDIGVHAVINQSSLSRALDSLDADGLIQRVTDEGDARATRVYLTQTGRDTFEHYWPCMSSAYERMFKDIPGEDRAVFLKTLKAILSNINKHEI